MNISCAISLPPGESAADNLVSTDTMVLADRVLRALGGDSAKDICHVTINDTGSAGPIPVAQPMIVAPPPAPDPAAKE
jgi:hypothetical protein